ncbi:minor capsid protein [Tuanshanicoccus yangjingiae]|uniref:minor capsid protein n=1 Tax=Aerococcaceae bacterium zg-252 TaxID=2796928 RepID=UPI0040628023
MTMVKDYWTERIKAEIENKIESDAEIGKEMLNLHNRHLRQIEKEIESFYQKYAKDEKIDVNEARKRASAFDVQAFADKAKHYVETKDFSPEANEALKLYNMKMKASRLELMQYHLELEMIALADGEYKLTEKFLNREYIQELNLQAGIMSEFIPSPKILKNMAKAIIDTPYHGATWSENIWKRQDALRTIVGSITKASVLRGRNATEYISLLRKEFKTGAYEARRLAVTETARVQTAVQKAMYDENGFDEYIYMAEPSACEICGSLDGKRFKVAEMQPGKNASPMHPHCRCSTAPATRARNIEQSSESRQEIKNDIIDVLKGDDELIKIREKFRILEEEKNGLEKAVDKVIKKRDNTPEIYKEYYTRVNVIEEAFENGKIDSKEYTLKLNEENKKHRERLKENKEKFAHQIEKIKQQLAENANLMSDARFEHAKIMKSYVEEKVKLGLGEVQAKDLLTSTRSDDFPLFEKSLEFIPTTWLQKSKDYGKIQLKKTSDRGYYSSWKKQLSLGRGSEFQKISTGVHEMMHRIEDVIPEILVAEAEFYQLRTGNDKLEKLRDVTGNKTYGHDEVTRKDDFINPYMGKDYKGRGYELLSMGVEEFYFGTELLRKDPKMFRWVFEMLTQY